MSFLFAHQLTIERLSADFCGYRGSKKISWTLEWILADRDNRRLREHNIVETTTLNDATHNSKVLPEDMRKQKGLKYFLVLQSPANVKRCTRIERTESIKEALRMQVVIEYPDILVSMNEKPEGWELIPRKIMEIKEADEKKPGNNPGKKRKHRGNGPVQNIQSVSAPDAENKVTVGAEVESKVGEAIEAPGEKALRLEDGVEEKLPLPILPEVDMPSGVGIEELGGPSEEPIEPAAKKIRIEYLE